MKPRRSLTEALAPAIEIPRDVEEQFVHGTKASNTPASHPAPETIAAEPKEGKGAKANSQARVPLTTRVRADFAEALKRASLERQLNKVFPNTLQDILEEALQPWLAANGYLK